MQDAGNRAHLLVRPDKVLYRVENEADLDEIIREHIIGGRVVERLKVSGKTIGRKFFELYGDVAFFNRQSRIALRHNGVLDPESMEEYFHYRGFQALAKVLEKGDPKWGCRRGHQVEASRPWRRRLCHGPEVGHGRTRRGENPLYHLQRRRGRSRRVHGPKHARVRSAQRGRGP